MSYFKLERALVESDQVGANTRIWAHVHVLPGASIGADCNICDNLFIENDVIICHNVTIKCGFQIWDGLRIEDDVFIGPNATFTNDIFPRSKQAFTQMQTVVKKVATVGANFTILPNITIGENDGRRRFGRHQGRSGKYSCCRQLGPHHQSSGVKKTWP